MEHNCIQIAEIATLKAKVDDLKEKVDDLKSVNESLAVLTTLQQESAKREEARDKREEEVNIDRRKQTETLIILSRMPEVIDKLDKKLDLQNEKLQAHDERFNDLDNKIANQVTDKTNKTEITKGKLVLFGTIITVICTTIGTIIVALLTK